ncbi:MAG: hypothetical protein ACJ8EB_03630, partial [Allosphingosinicella sp.]
SSSAMNPTLLMILLCTPWAIPAAYLSQYPANMFFMGLAGLPPLVGLLQIVFFTIFDRDRLQNDKHVENKMLIERIQGQLGDKAGEVTIDQSSPLSDNPRLLGGE